MSSAAEVFEKAAPMGGLFKDFLDWLQKNMAES